MFVKAGKGRSKAGKGTIIHLQRLTHQEMVIFHLVISGGSIKEKKMIISGNGSFIKEE